MNFLNVRYCTPLICLTLLILIFGCKQEQTKKNLPSIDLEWVGNASLDNLSSSGGSLKLKITSSFTKWRIRAKSPLSGAAFITSITPDFGGSEELADLETEVIINYQATNKYVMSQQNLLIQLLSEETDSKDDVTLLFTQQPVDGMPISVEMEPEWSVSERILQEGPNGAFDEIAVKDPTIVYHNDRYHLFYTGRDSTRWRTGYATSSDLKGFKDAEHVFMGSLNGGGYFCAPQVFWFQPHEKWYLIYQSGLGATFSTTDDISNPQSWQEGQTMGFGDGIDFWCISDGYRVYVYYSAQDGSRSIKQRNTLTTDFPFGWSEPITVAEETFEAVHVYKNKTDGHYYMIVEDIQRHQELWEATSLGGKWTKLEEQWAHHEDLVDLSDHWTDQVSHIEVIRSGNDELMEVDDLNRCTMLFQGVVSGDYGAYEYIPYDLGMIKNY